MKYDSFTLSTTTIHLNSSAVTLNECILWPQNENLKTEHKFNYRQVLEEFTFSFRDHKTYSKSDIQPSHKNQTVLWGTQRGHSLLCDIFLPIQ